MPRRTRLREERHDLPALVTLLLGREALPERGLLEDIAARRVRAARLLLLGRRLCVVFARGAGAEARETAERFLASVELDAP
jgi:hypothetical protein